MYNTKSNNLGSPKTHLFQFIDYYIIKLQVSEKATHRTYWQIVSSKKLAFKTLPRE